MPVDFLGWGSGVAAAASYSSVILLDTPTVYLKLNETSGTTATDSSGNSNNGAYVAGVLLGNAPLDGDTTSFSMSVPGVGRATSSTLPTVGGFSMECIAYQTRAGFGRIFATDVYNAGKGLCLNANNSTNGLVLSFNAGVGSFSNTVIDSNLWQLATKCHIVLTYTSGALKVYINGVPVYTNAGVTGNYVPSVTYTLVTIGDDPAAAGTFLGQIQNYALYPVALTAAQVRTHAQAMRF